MLALRLSLAEAAVRRLLAGVPAIPPTTPNDAVTLRGEPLTLAGQILTMGA